MLPKVDKEFKSLIPALTSDEREQLEQNILFKGKCHDAIVLWDGIIIDGHNRFEICVKHGIEFKIEELKLPSREATKVWILENQLGRRNLTDAKRIEIVLLKADIIRKKAEKKQIDAGKTRASGKNDEKLLPKTSKPKMKAIHVQETLAAEAGISKGTFYNYTQVKEHANPKLLARVQSGEVKIGTAHRLLTTEVKKQLYRADKMYKFMASAIPLKGLKAAKPELR